MLSKSNHASSNTLDWINKKGLGILEKLGIVDRTEPYTHQKPKINLKDHKNSFENDPDMRLICALKLDIGHISKNRLEKTIWVLKIKIRLSL